MEIWVRVGVSLHACHMVQFLFLALKVQQFLILLFVVPIVFSRFGQEMPPKSRASQRLMAHNASPARESRKRTRNERERSHDRRESSRSSRRNKSPSSPTRKDRRSKSSSRSDSPSNTPSWAKKILEAHEKSEERLQALERELKSRPATKRSREKSPTKPDFKFKRNKIQYELNENVLEQLDVAASTSVEAERNEALEEGKRLLKERNKHIMLAEKYGWDAVDCYVQEPLAIDSDDDKRIRRAVKESKALKADNKRPSKPRAQFSNRFQQSFTSNSGPNARRVVIPASRQKSDPSQSEVCFRCGRAGHFAKTCRAPIPATTTGKTY